MSGNRGCFFNSLLFLIIVFVPLVGHIIETVMVLEDDHSLAGKVLWFEFISLVAIPIYVVPLHNNFLSQRQSHFRFDQAGYIA